MFWNFISIVATHDRADYTGKMWKESGNVYGSYEIFTANIESI